MTASTRQPDNAKQILERVPPMGDNGRRRVGGKERGVQMPQEKKHRDSHLTRFEDQEFVPVLHDLQLY